MSSHLTLLELVKSCVFSTPYMTCKTVWKISIKKYWNSSKGKSVLVVLAFGKCSFFFSWKAGLIIHPHLCSQPFRPNIFSTCLSPKYVNFITKVKQICLNLRDFAISSCRGICGLDINEKLPVGHRKGEWGNISAVLRAVLLCSISFPSLYRLTRGVYVFPH